MSQAIQICADAYRQANLDQDLVSFDTHQEFPYNIALSLMNTVIQEMNRMGNYWFTQTKTALPYSAGVSQWSLSTLGIDPKRIIKVQREASGFGGQLVEINWNRFEKRYGLVSPATGQPNFWSKYNGTLYLSTQPDQDYQLQVYHYQDLPLVALETDTLPVPAINEDVLREGVYAYLSERIGRPDFQGAYQLFRDKADSLMSTMGQDAGLPAQMPAAF